MTLYTVNADTYVEVNGVPLATPAWRTLNVQELLSDAPRRGSDVVVPRSHGTLARRRWKNAATHTLEMLISGTNAWYGPADADPVRQLWLNIDHLRTNVSDTVDSGGGTVAMKLYLPNAVILTADGHVGPLTIGAGNKFYVRATLDVSIPAGEFS